MLGAELCTYVLVQMRRRITRRSDWKLNRADGRLLAVLSSTLNGAYHSCWLATVDVLGVATAGIELWVCVRKLGQLAVRGISE